MPFFRRKLTRRVLHNRLAVVDPEPARGRVEAIQPMLRHGHGRILIDDGDLVVRQELVAFDERFSIQDFDAGIRTDYK